MRKKGENDELKDLTMETEEVPFQLLLEITDGFSEQRKLGEGSFGVVYKGVTKNGKEVAVKKFRNVTQDIGYKQFQNELYNLMKVKHNNIVHLIAYCYEIEKTSVVVDGRKVPVEETHRALCFEYLHNRSLQNYLSDGSCGLDWHIWYKIIEGICDGLKHIHEELEEPLYHLDLKPDNILLDKNMVPKIADFGLSRIFGDELTRTTRSPLGTHGFQPPEYIDKGEVSKKFDIFSLGVIIKRILSKHDDYFKDLSMSANELIDQVTKGWRNKLQKTGCSESLVEKCCNQVAKCTQIALKCMEIDSQERPNIVEIIDWLNETTTDIVEIIPRKGCHITVSGMATHRNTRMEPTYMLDSECHQEYFDVREELIVGRTKEKNKVINLLKGITQKLVILPIYGIGGIGKTTFARMIYSDTNFKNYTQVWVDVQDRFDVTKIRNSIISQLHESENKSNGRQMTHSCIMKAVPRKNILIVLDDLWEPNPVKLDELKENLYNDGSNTIVLVTTRDERVAKKLCTNLMNPYKIEFLTDDMCWDIIKQRSGFEARDDKEYVLDVGRDIAQKCGGVALAAKSLGFMLKSMTSYQWKEVNDCDIWNESISKDTSTPNHVLQSLKLSYESMDTYLNLKLCFTYCGMFPKGHKIVKDDLIHQWISLGFIRPTEMMSIMQVSENYIVQLLGLSFLEHSEPPQTYKVYGEHDTVFTMHHLVHDLAISVLGDEILDQSKQGNTRGWGCLYQYALLSDCSKPLELCMTSPARLRALRFIGCAGTELRGVAFAPAESLQVLDLSDCSIQKFSGCIGELKQLRYLNSPGIQDQMLPECITKLSNLMYLNLKGSPTILALPESIGEMESLAHLDLSGCSGIGELPGSFGELKNLEYVDFAECSNVTGISQYLATLTKLQYLNLSYCKNIGKAPSALGSLIELQYLNLSHSSYIGMNENGYAMEYLGTLTKLRYLNLSVSGMSSFRVLPETLGRLTELRYLNLSGHVVLVRLPRSFVNLRSLVHLELSNCAHIGNVPAVLNGLTKLQYLDLFQCSMIKYTQTKGLKGLQEVLGNLSELRWLGLRSCFESIFGEQAVYEGDSFLGHICTLTNLEYLDLSRNDNLYSLPETLGNLRKLRTLDLSLCTNLERLPASISEIDSLRFLYTLSCQRLDKSTLPQHKNSSTSLLLPHFVVHAAGDGESSSNLFQLEDENHTFLEISMLENVMSAEEAQRIRLVEKQMIRSLEFVWTRDAKRFVEDSQVLRELEPPNSVLRLRLQGYNSLTFPTWMMGLVTYLPHLIAIYMVDMPNCNKLPPLGQLPNLQFLQIKQMDNIRKIDDDLYGGTRPFGRLENLLIEDMKCLEEWDMPSLTACGEDEDGLRISQMDQSNSNRMVRGFEDIKLEVMKWREEKNSRGLANLKWLLISNCPKLRFKAGLLQGDYCRYKMTVTSSDQVLQSSWGATASASPSTTTRVRTPTHLVVEHCEAPLHQWSMLRHLPRLEELHIKGCSDLTCSSSSTDLFGGLSSLRTLTVQDCEGIAALPERLGDLTSLRTLKIGNCRGIRTLPESIRQLTNLQRLKISACLHLWKEPMDKLHHIKEIEIDGQRLLSSRYLRARLVALRLLALLGEKRHYRTFGLDCRARRGWQNNQTRRYSSSDLYDYIECMDHDAEDYENLVFVSVPSRICYLSD